MARAMTGNSASERPGVSSADNWHICWALPMIIDAHAHVTAPESLYAHEDIIKALNAPVYGGSSHLAQLREAGSDMQIISPRPYQMMHSEHPKLVTSFMEETNDIIARRVTLFPETFRGVCGPPQSPGVRKQPPR